MTETIAPEVTDEEILANRAVWIAALTSGDYKQGQDQLATPDYKRYCCLGVACEVVGPKYGVRREHHKDEYANETFYSWDNSEYDEDYEGCEDCNDAVRREYGELPAPLFLPLGLSYENQNILTSMNDAEGATFTDIAAYIDELPVSREMYA